MAALVGISDSTGYSTNVIVNSVGGTKWVGNPFVASASGTATTIQLYTTDAVGDAPNIKLIIYSNADAQLGVTSAVATAAGNNWTVGTLVTPVAITSGVTYKLGWIAESGYTGYRTTASPGDAYEDVSGTYASPPATISPSLNSGIDSFAIFADGTISGGATISRLVGGKLVGGLLVRNL